MLYPDRSLRAAQSILAANESGPTLLWSCGISGDLPIVLVLLETEGGVELAKQLLRARGYWRRKRLAVDLVILNEAPAAAPSWRAPSRNPPTHCSVEPPRVSCAAACSP